MVCISRQTACVKAQPEAEAAVANDFTNMIQRSRYHVSIRNNVYI